jgi:hypothetical protein
MSPSEIPGSNRPPTRAVDYSLAGQRAAQTEDAGIGKIAAPSQHTELAFDFLQNELKRQNEVVAHLKQRLEPVFLQAEQENRQTTERGAEVRNHPRSTGPVAARIHMYATSVQENTDALEAFIRALTI